MLCWPLAHRGLHMLDGNGPFIGSIKLMLSVGQLQGHVIMAECRLWPAENKCASGEKYAIFERRAPPSRESAHVTIAPSQWHRTCRHIHVISPAVAKSKSFPYELWWHGVS